MKILSKQKIIPKDWNLKKIKDFAADVISGGTPSTIVSEYWGGNILWMNSGELNNKKIYDVEGRITQKGLIESSTRQIPEKSILIGLAGQGKTRGTVAINFVKLCINQSIAAVLPNESFVPEFLYYNLDHRYKELRSLSTGASGRGGLNLGIIKNIHVALPSTKKEQEKIVAVLFDTDNLINNLETLIKKKKNIEQGAMQELLTGKRRLEGFHEEWEISELGKLGYFKGGNGFPEKYQGNKSGEIPFYKVSDLNNKGNEIFMSHSNNYISKEINLNLKAFIFPTNSIVFAKIGAAIFLERKRLLTQKSCLDNNLMGFIINTEKINLKFLYYVFLNISLGELVETTALPSLSGNNIEKLLINFPIDNNEQDAITKIFTNMDSEIDQLEKKLAKYKMIKQGMIQKLLTGEIRIK